MGRKATIVIHQDAAPRMGDPKLFRLDGNQDVVACAAIPHSGTPNRFAPERMVGYKNKNPFSLEGFPPIREKKKEP